MKGLKQPLSFQFAETGTDGQLIIRGIDNRSDRAEGVQQGLSVAFVDRFDLQMNKKRGDWRRAEDQVALVSSCRYIC